MAKKIKIKSLLPRTSFLGLLLLLATPLHAQEAPGEDIPGMRTTRDASATIPAPSPTANSQDLTPKERDGLNNMFKGEIDGEKPPAPPPAPPAVYAPSVPASADANAVTPSEPLIAPLQSPSLYMDNTRLLKFNILNKQNTRLYPQELSEGGSLTYGPLTIRLIECWHSSPDVASDSAALLEITEVHTDFKQKTLFLGWMFASTPSLNPLEHAVYDISIKECK